MSYINKKPLRKSSSKAAKSKPKKKAATHRPISKYATYRAAKMKKCVMIASLSARRKKEQEPVKPITVEEFDKLAEEGGDITPYIDLSKSWSGHELPPGVATKSK
jgi:hypothetical protein